VLGVVHLNPIALALQMRRWDVAYNGRCDAVASLLTNVKVSTQSTLVQCRARMTLLLLIFGFMKDELVWGLRTLVLWCSGRMCPSPTWPAPSELFLRIHVHGDWWCRSLWSHSALQSFVSLTLLVVVFHVLQARERGLGANGVALASRIIVQLGSCARENVRFPVLAKG
jgi:hypothetical protein